jgi:hypothetical protein
VLGTIAETVKPREVVGALIGLELQGKVQMPGEDHLRFHRGREGIVNPDIAKMEAILNHMRVFAIESFRYIPQFDLRDIQGNYFKDHTIFLMTLLEMVRTDIIEPRFLYIIKKYSSQWNAPRRAAIVPHQAILKIFRWEKLDRKQLSNTRARLECEEVFETIHNLLKWKIPFSKVIALNNGDEWVPADVRTEKEPALIPRIIHQVWLGTKELPPAKKYLLQKTKMLYPDYEIKLWGKDNITLEKFPLTYDVVNNLLAFNKVSPYSKLATVTDILRHEILYNEGGFWKDAGMNLLRPIFDKFRSYKIVIASDKTFRYRWLQGMCFFANVPKIENMWRITNYRNLNRMRIYLNYAPAIAGPIDFRQFLIGQEEYDKDVLCLPYESFYPAQVTEHPLKDLCTKQKQDLSADDSYGIVENGWYLLLSCPELYPFSYGLEHNRFGDSWAKRQSK